MLKSIKKYGILVLIAMVVMTSCIDKNARKNNYPGGGSTYLPLGDIYTIDSLLQIWKSGKTLTFTNDASVYGIVTADETSGNLYKASFIQDGDKAIELYMKSTSGLRIGDYVRVYLKGATLSEYSGTPQIQDLNPNNVEILANNRMIAPDTISIEDIPTTTLGYKDYVCKLVTLTHVEFQPDDRDSTFAQNNAYGQYFLAQCDDDCNYVDTTKIMVRTSNYASFAKTQLPQGNGMITGILTFYSNNSQWQFTVRSLSEVKMNADPCKEKVPYVPPIEPQGTGTENDPYNMAAAIVHQGDTAQWIRGYIVGAANIASGTITNDSQISWGPEFTYNENMTNFILADKNDERDINKCIVVYLPHNAASGIRQINLKDHPENLGKTLKVKGDLKTYLGKSGMKKTNEYTLTD